MSEPVKKLKSVAEQLAEGMVPETEAVAPAAAPADLAGSMSDSGLLGQLVKLLLLKEGREAAKAQQEFEANASRQKQRDRNARDKDSNALLKQARCRHLKGGSRKGPKAQQKDYAVYQHTFINAVTVIRCQLCGMRWFMQDTVEYLVRSGKKIANHTKAGWREAVDMLEMSTNTASSSEIPGRILVTGTDAANSPVHTDSAGQPYVARVVDLEGKAVANVEI